MATWGRDEDGYHLRESLLSDQETPRFRAALVSIESQDQYFRHGLGSVNLL